MKEEQRLLKEMQKLYPDRFSLLGKQILHFSLSGQLCDITFRDRGPILDVKIGQQITLALMYGAGPKKLKEMLENIPLSNGEHVSINDIWVIVPMPKGGIPQDELDAVDLSEGTKQAGPNGETVREMIRETYHCNSTEEEDRYLRRFLAS
jgi:hypothetical protein